jgi:hypothetical protein
VAATAQSAAGAGTDFFDVDVGALPVFAQGTLSVVNVTAVAFGDKLGIRDPVIVLVQFDKPFDEQPFAACSPRLALNLAASAQAIWFPRSYFHDQYMLEDQELASALGFLYVIAPGDSARPLDVGAPGGLKSSALTFSCATTAAAVNASALAALSIVPQLDVSSKAAVPVFVRALQAGSFGVGDHVDIVVDFDTPVEIVSMGTAATNPVPAAAASSNSGKRKASSRSGSSVQSSATTLALNNGARATLVGYSPSSKGSKKALLFVFTVAPGDDTPALDVDWTVGFKIGSQGVFSSLSGISIDDRRATASGPKPSLRNFATVSIATGAARFPPANYDRRMIPYPTGASRRPAVTSTPVVVNVILDFGSIFEVNDRSQSFRADVTLRQTWIDSRFANASLPFVTHLSTRHAFDAIWQPRLTFHNTREFLKAMDFHCRVYGNGTVQLQQRFIHTFSTRLNARRFPFDSQNFTVILRSASFDQRSVLVKPAPSVHNSRSLRRTEAGRGLKLHSDGTWKFRAIQLMNTPNTNTMLYANSSFLYVTVVGDRISTFTVVVLLLPCIAICLAQVVSFFFPLKSDWRMSVCVTGLFAIITFNFVLVQLSPPVSYMTTMTLLSLCTTCVCLLNLVFQTFIRSIFGAIELIRKEGKEGKDKKEGKDGGEKKSKGDYVELGSEHDFGAPPQDKRNAPLHSLSACFCVRVTQDNRLMWLRRIMLWNEIGKAAFVVVVVAVILSCILPAALHV